MVTIEKKRSRQRLTPSQLCFIVVAGVVFMWVTWFGTDNEEQKRLLQQGQLGQVKPQVVSLVPEDYTIPPDQKQAEKDGPPPMGCPYGHLSQLTKEERYPKQGSRHMVAPPVGGTVTLVCCSTTAGPLNFVAREKWAPLGAERVLEMVRTGYFSSHVPLMRCIAGFLCQFGLSGSPANNKKYGRSNLKDDPNWLPEGPDFKKNKQGIKRFARGYLGYAGAGPNTRGNQLIVSLTPVGPLGGGSPWEVPWGELVGKHSFETLGKFFTGYGENGPSQPVITKNGISEEVKKKWPKLDYITGCEIVDEEDQPTASSES